jgi:hypothetical protein
MNGLKIPPNIGKAISNKKDLDRLNKLVEKFNEDPSKSGEICQLTDDELSTPPTWMIRLTNKEVELLNNFDQPYRVELYWMHQSLKTDESFADFLRRQIIERKKFEEATKWLA